MSGRQATGHPLPGQPPENPLGAIVIGAGQAGLSAAGELVRRGAVVGEDLLVLDAEDGPGGAWRHRWESLTIGKAHRIADLPPLPRGRPGRVASQQRRRPRVLRAVRGRPRAPRPAPRARHRRPLHRRPR